MPNYGNERLREITDDDFYLFADLDLFNFNILNNALVANGIEVSVRPYYPLGVSLLSAGRAKGRKIFIRYKDKDKATEIYNVVFGKIENETAISGNQQTSV